MLYIIPTNVKIFAVMYLFVHLEMQLWLPRLAKSCISKWPQRLIPYSQGTAPSPLKSLVSPRFHCVIGHTYTKVVKRQKNNNVGQKTKNKTHWYFSTPSSWLHKFNDFWLMACDCYCFGDSCAITQSFFRVLFFEFCPLYWVILIVELILQHIRVCVCQKIIATN